MFLETGLLIRAAEEAVLRFQTVPAEPEREATYDAHAIVLHIYARRVFRTSTNRHPNRTA